MRLRPSIFAWLASAVIILATPLPLTAQEEAALRLQRLDGISHNSVHAVTQDGEGFLWIGTSDGLSRYDGYEA